VCACILYVVAPYFPLTVVGKKCIRNAWLAKAPSVTELGTIIYRRSSIYYLYKEKRERERDKRKNALLANKTT
jgi:hypothetical protein